MPSSSSAAIRGDGVAACCCAHLLQIPVERLDRPRVPAIMISGATQALINDVFGRGDLFQDSVRVEKRVVAWGAAGKTELPHSAVILSERELCQRLMPEDGLRHGDAEWTVFASRPLPGSPGEQHFGSRRASAVNVTLRAGAPRGVCWIESLENGWLFLTPAEADRAWLLAAGGDTQELLGHSSVVAEEIDTVGAGGSSFPAYPRIADTLCGPGWLACGTAALAFDPLCGDGTGNAIREAILASAVIQAAFEGGETAGLLAHYRARLLSAFRRHLQLCREFYLTGGSGPWWAAEVDGIRLGLEWCERQLADFTNFRYRLTGFQLHACP